MEIGGSKRTKTAEESKKKRGPENNIQPEAKNKQCAQRQGGDGGGQRHRGENRSGNQKQKTVLNVLYCNARSIVSKIKDLELISSENEPDIILITESWCNSDTQNILLNIPNYYIDPKLRVDRNDTYN